MFKVDSPNNRDVNELKLSGTHQIAICSQSRVCVFGGTLSLSSTDISQCAGIKHNEQPAKGSTVLHKEDLFHINTFIHPDGEIKHQK